MTGTGATPTGRPTAARNTVALAFQPVGAGAIATRTRSAARVTFLPAADHRSHMAPEPEAVGVASDRIATPGFGFFFSA